MPGSTPAKKPTKETHTAAALFASTNKITCSYCRQDYSSNSCGVVAQPQARRKVLQRSGRCFVCLRHGHLSRDCGSRNKCFKCSGRHHVSICMKGDNPTSTPQQGGSDQTRTGNSPAVQTRPPPSDTPAAPRSGLNAAAPTFQGQEQRPYVNSHCSILLQTAQAQAFNPKSPRRSLGVRILFDSGSQRSYITQRVAGELSLQSEGTQRMTILTFGSTQERSQHCSCVQLNFELRNGQTKQLLLYTVPCICEALSTHPIPPSHGQLDHLKGLHLAELEIDILVGSDQYWDLVTGKIRRGRAGPIAINTVFGWVLSGPAMSSEQSQASASLLTHVLRVNSSTQETLTLDDRLKTFWDLESLGISPSLYESPVCEEFENSIQFIDVRYQVELPWKQSHPPLADHYNLCLKRLRGLLRRLQGDSKVLHEYDAIIKDQMQRGMVEIVEDDNPDEDRGKVHYMPHHAVVRHDKDTTKVRVVYDGSARSDGPSLNDCLHAGPKFNQRIFDILLRFRLHRVAITADIEKAFLMVSVASKDRDVLRFLWFSDVFSDQPNLIQLRFARVVTSSPYLLNATLRHHIEQYRGTHPDLVETFSKAAYVDDIVTGADDKEQALALFSTAKEILADGGFNLRKFYSNSALLQMKVDNQETPNSEPSADESYAGDTLGTGQLVKMGERKVFGVRWDPAMDQLILNLEQIAYSASRLEPTKRAIVSLVGLHQRSSGYSIPSCDFTEDLRTGAMCGKDGLGSALNRINPGETSPILLSHCYLEGITKQILSYHLCGFCDASLKAYAAVVYLILDTSTQRHIRILASKTRVAPLKTQTIPRLELLSALLLARLVDSVAHALEGEVSLASPHCFSDSTVAVFWIRGEDKTWKPFVQNRVQEIRALLPSVHWSHCPGQDNPADLPSRGCTHQHLSECQFWLTGPEWLKQRSYTQLKSFTFKCQRSVDRR